MYLYIYIYIYICIYIHIYIYTCTVDFVQVEPLRCALSLSGAGDAPIALLEEGSVYSPRRAGMLPLS